MDIILKQFKSRALIARVEDNMAYQYVIGSCPTMLDGKMVWYDGDYYDDLEHALYQFNRWVERNAAEEGEN